ncbi:MAG TPA: site-specific integrase [Kiritimatiellia bacterium]|nr:site-specific integrase [Kiritimatiellia bacterium]
MSKRQETIQFLTHNELRALLDKAKRQSPRDYCMILLAYRHGLRAHELCNITTENIDLEAGNIRCVRGKGSISNWQQLAQDEVKAIKGWLRQRPKNADPHLFVSRKGTPVSRSQFFRIFQGLTEEAGLPEQKRHPHILKHSLGTHLANSGVPIQVIQQRLGHRNIQNTMVYLTISSAYVDRAFESALANGAVV